MKKHHWIVMSLGAALVAGAMLFAGAESEKQPTAQTTASRAQVTAPIAVAKRQAVGMSVDAKVATRLHAYAKQPASVVALAPDGAERGKQAMRAWTERVMNLEAANQRESSRFLRTSYTQEQARDVPMHLGDRRDGRGAFAAAAATGTVSVLYRESDSGTDMRFQKMKEQGTPSGKLMPQGEALAQAESFFVANGFIQPSGDDTIIAREVRDRRRSEEVTGGGELDYLAQQDLVLRRGYEGKPVINSSATVGVLPGSDEVVLVKLTSWSPAAEGGKTEVKPAYDDARAKVLAGELADKLQATISAQLGGEADTAIVRDMEESWFQSERDGLVPVLVFSVEIAAEHAGEDQHTVAVAMTPYHDSAILWEQGRAPREAAPAPATASAE